MVRMSMLRNRPVICGDKRLGLLHSVCLDRQRQCVTALVVSCGLRGKCVVLPECVESISDQFILVRRSERYKRSFEPKDSGFVRSVSGVLAGRVTDYALDEQNMRVLALEMIPGYLPRDRRKRMWITSYSCPSGNGGELVVSIGAGQEPRQKREE